MGQRKVDGRNRHDAEIGLSHSVPRRTRDDTTLQNRSETRDRRVDPLEDQTKNFRSVTIPQGGKFHLSPGGFALASTVEAFTLPADLVARVDGRSSIGRCGLAIHVTAGFIDPGWTAGTITLELVNHRTVPIMLPPGMIIAQVVFEGCLAAQRPYGSPGLGSRYQGQVGVTAAKSHDA